MLQCEEDVCFSLTTTSLGIPSGGKSAYKETVYNQRRRVEWLKKKTAMVQNKPVNDITWSDIEALCSEKVEESQQLDFKQEIPGSTYSSRRKFLRDVCAMANSGGGDIVFGIKEDPAGIAGGICAIASDQIDNQILRLQNSVISTIQPIPGLSIVPIKDNRGNAVVLLRVRAGLTGPHSVWFDGRRHFTGRRPRSTDDLTMEEIRTMFVGGATLTQRIRSFRMDRLQKIRESPPVPSFIQGKGMAFVHIVPLDALDAQSRIIIQNLNEMDWLLPGASSANWRKNLDGLLTMDANYRFNECSWYVQVFRTGIVEIGYAGFVRESESGTERNLRAGIFDKLLIQCCNRFVPQLRNLGIASPLAIFISLCDVVGCRVLNGSAEVFPYPTGSLESNAYDRDTIAPPEVQVDHDPDKWEHALRPLCDLVWQAGNWSGSPLFDEKGNLKGARTPPY